MTGLIPAHAGKTVTQITHDYDRAAHPRSRGENGLVLDVVGGSGGSSPLTRGKFKQRLQHRAPEGLIPAHAGKIRLHYASRPVYRAHPRSRGENTARTGRRRAVRGSSPLTRGKLADGTVIVAGNGLIPAHAGKI